MPVDARHGRHIPEGQRMAGPLRRLLRRIGQVAWSDIRHDRPIYLLHWRPMLVETCGPLLQTYVESGGRDAIKRIRREAAERGAKAMALQAYAGRTKDRSTGTGDDDANSGSPPVRLEVGFDVFNARVIDAIREMTLAFADSTLRTATVEVEHAREAFRASLREGLEKGEALTELARRTRQIFDNPARAHMIAASEASRAMHAGQLMAAEESGVVAGLEWLASDDACPECEALNGHQVKLGEPFVVDKYGPVYHAPRHPWCQCTNVEVLK